MDSIFDTSYRSITDKTSEREFYLLLLKIASFIGDGHNGIIPTPSLLNDIVSCQTLLPLEVVFTNGKLLIDQNRSNNKVPLEGKQLMAINGVNADSIISELIRIAPREGKTLFYESSIDQLFRLYYHLIFGFSDSYRVDYLVHNTTQTAIVLGSSLDTIRSRGNENRIDPTPFQFQIVDSLNTAILTLQSFDQNFLKKEHNIKFRKEVKEAFSILREKRVESLIIDLRENSGGNPEFAVDILEQVLKKPFRLVKECRVVASKSEEDFYQRTKQKWYPAYGLGMRNVVGDPFSGDLFVLIDESSFSAAVMLARALKDYKRATLIGRETGGNSVVMGGYFMRTSWSLPNTKIEVMPSTLCTLNEDLESNS